MAERARRATAKKTTRAPAATRTRPAAAATRRAPVAPVARTPRPVAPTTADTGVVAPLAAGAPAGFGAATLGADVSGQLRAVAPTFGQVLNSVGTGVADSQTALDKGVIDTVNALAAKKIKVITDVVQHLNDDGEPVPADTELFSTDLSVLSFFMPTIHEWKRVAVSMDLTVGAFSETDGLNFNAHQGGGGVGVVGLFWGFLGVGETTSFDHSQSATVKHEQEASWSAGEVRLDATLGPRQTGNFPAPTQMSVGPQIVFSQGAVTETPVAGAGVNRSIDVTVSVRTAAGLANPTKSIVVDAAGLRTSFSNTAPFTGALTNAAGQVLVTITRNVPNSGTGPVRATLVARLGHFSQTYTLVI